MSSGFSTSGVTILRAKYVAALTTPTADRASAATPAAPAATRLFGATRRIDGTKASLQVQNAFVDLPIALPVSPMLAKAVAGVPAPDSVAGGLAYEPKWDGFRCIVLRDGDEVELASRGSKPLTRYFPEVVRAVLEHLPSRCAIDAEIVVRKGSPGAQRLDWESLSQRIHPADSRVQRLATETPAELICFDILALGDDDLTGLPFGSRREQLESVLSGLAADTPIHLTRTTSNPPVAQDWFERFEGAGLDGVVAKGLSAPYQQGKRVMFKVKHSRTAEAVVIGYRIHKSGSGVRSLLLGLYNEEGTLYPVGGISAFTDTRRLELVDELAPLMVTDDQGEPEGRNRSLAVQRQQGHELHP